MPYDPQKTANLLKIVGAFANHPTGDYIAELGKQLAEAEGEIANAAAGRIKAEADANKYASELATMQSTARQLRDENESLKAATPKQRTKKVAPLIALPETIVTKAKA